LARIRSVPTWSFEHAAHDAGHATVAGIDEAGRGPIAGPVVAACVVLPDGIDVGGVADSKSLTGRQRADALDHLERSGASIGIGTATAAEIDRHNILQATHLAMRRALDACPERPDFVLIDGLAVPLFPIPHRALIGGDALCVSIAAASIVAKVTRDRYMEELDHAWPGYGLAQHKGYPTRSHLAALQQLGPMPEHRRSFGPVRTVLEPSREPRARASTPGLTGEAMATEFLTKLNYIILARRYRAQHGEIDIIALDRDAYVFVEVKTAFMRGEDPPAARVSPAQQSRLQEAALEFLSVHGDVDAPCRFDVIEVVLDRGHPDIRHHQGAFP